MVDFLVAPTLPLKRPQGIKMPGFIKPQLATLRSKAPKSGNHEIKYDGYRVQLHLNQGKAKAYTRNGLDWTKRFAVIARAFDIPGQAIIDGEVVVVLEGRTNFGELQADLARGSQDRLLYYAFDLLWLDGQDLRKLPQIERNWMLRGLFDAYELNPPVLYSEHLEGDGQELFEHASKLNYEGIVSKKADAPYRSDRNDGWLKVKAVQREKFPVVGFVKDSTGVPALYLVSKTAENWCIWARLAPAGRAPSPAKSASNSTRLLVRSLS
ncbi:ATP-dependent DNA ligase [Bradyrhizobium altum]|uniref:ATP-dependent DNA ligase n=1 Tax=Bradyrhizobium altum TaxID=1571202 RepID=UPI00289FD50A|nr:RNA ligase family protein [Bradyrhizobium altum]